MDKRLKKNKREVRNELRAELYTLIENNAISVKEAISHMHKLSQLTLPEFAKAEGLSVPSLQSAKRVGGGKNFHIDTLNKIGAPFGLEIAFVEKKRQTTSDSFQDKNKSKAGS